MYAGVVLMGGHIHQRVVAQAFQLEEACITTPSPVTTGIAGGREASVGLVTCPTCCAISPTSIVWRMTHGLCANRRISCVPLLHEVILQGRQGLACLLQPSHPGNDSSQS